MCRRQPGVGELRGVSVANVQRLAEYARNVMANGMSVSSVPADMKPRV